MTRAAVASDINQPLNILLDLAPEIAFYFERLLNDRGNLSHFLIRQILGPLGGVNPRFPQNFIR